MFTELKNQKSSYSVSGNSDGKGEYSPQVFQKGSR